MADAFGAKVTQGARVAIVANSHLRLAFTASQAIATVDRTRILIVAIDGFTDADALFAMVTNGARVAV